MSRIIFRATSGCLGGIWRGRIVCVWLTSYPHGCLWITAFVFAFTLRVVVAVHLLAGGLDISGYWNRYSLVSNTTFVGGFGNQHGGCLRAGRTVVIDSRFDTCEASDNGGADRRYFIFSRSSNRRVTLPSVSTCSGSIFAGGDFAIINSTVTNSVSGNNGGADFFFFFSVRTAVKRRRRVTLPTLCFRWARLHFRRG